MEENGIGEQQRTMGRQMRKESQTQHRTSFIFLAEGNLLVPFFISKGILATSQGLVKEKALSSAKQGTDLKMGLCPAQCENSEICIEESKKPKTALQERER